MMSARYDGLELMQPEFPMNFITVKQTAWA